MANLRLFLAAELAPAVLDRLGECQAALKPGYPNLRFLARESMHLTLKFLGAIAEERLDALQQTVAPLVADTPACQIALTNLTAFPSWRRVNVVVSECSAPEPLALLYERLQRAFTAFGVRVDERKFRPHITIARPRDRRAGGMQPADLKFEGVTSSVREVVLFESRLGPGGAKYEARARWPLRG